LCHKCPRICSICCKHFPVLSSFMTGFVTRLTRRVSLVEQDLPTLLEHISSPRIFSGVRVTRSLALCVRFVDRCLSLCTFSFGHCVVCSSIYRFWLPLWYLQTLLPIFLHSTLFHKNAYQITMFANDVNMLCLNCCGISVTVQNKHNILTFLLELFIA
jgi:hypothetical protein